MIDSLNQVSLFAAFSAGLLSFVSPCVLPLVPSYVSYITGLSLEQLTDAAERHRLRKSIMVNSLLFIAGFSTVFIAFGASASFIGQVMYEYQDIIRKIGAVFIIIFGLYMVGLLKLNFLMTEHHLVQFDKRPVGYVGSFLIGTAFAAAWTPCVGPILGAILAYASTTESMQDGIMLLASYSLGLGLPLFITAFSVDSFLNYFKKARLYLRGVSVVGGSFLILAGVLIYGDSLTRITSFLERNGIGWYIGQ
ncbi:cytochrome c biogenesis CcdA family protein [Candidatus Nitronereus thalassa]|uniref:Cytochrome c biogenesis protein CcdA n=1 Tax=Candidatus Nitronereus thalassa TaxID=3020898 RepID=A0ABU3K844_9BACT|nr:cytochrome c biogenesis protein CcdA [Candidatus Nitronereus thalassa]MDT7042571.1 cytochrome c biogenesis protein CcdA [Candidatus Nitronereus thalassa]